MLIKDLVANRLVGRKSSKLLCFQNNMIQNVHSFHFFKAFIEIAVTWQCYHLSVAIFHTTLIDQMA